MNIRLLYFFLVLTVRWFLLISFNSIFIRNIVFFLQYFFHTNFFIWVCFISYVFSFYMFFNCIRIIYAFFLNSDAFFNYFRNFIIVFFVNFHNFFHDNLFKVKFLFNSVNINFFHSRYLFNFFFCTFTSATFSFPTFCSSSVYFRTLFSTPINRTTSRFYRSTLFFRSLNPRPNFLSLITTIPSRIAFIFITTSTNTIIVIIINAALTLIIVIWPCIISGRWRRWIVLPSFVSAGIASEILSTVLVIPTRRLSFSFTPMWRSFTVSSATWWRWKPVAVTTSASWWSRPRLGWSPVTLYKCLIY